MNPIIAFVTQVLVFLGVPMAIMLSISCSLLYLASMLLLTVVYGLIGWHFQPLVRNRPVVVGDLVWLIPPLLMAVAGLMWLGEIVFAPVMIYFCACSLRSATRTQNAEWRNIPIQWTRTILGWVLVLLLCVFIVVGADVLVWLVWVRVILSH